LFVAHDKEKLAVITGGSQGIGLAIAHGLAARGYTLFLIARSENNLQVAAESIRERYKVHVAYMTADLATAAGIAAVAQYVQNSDAEILVNNAGFGMAGPFADTDWQQAEEMLLLNIQALTRLCHAAIPAMRAAGRGYILNIASLAAFQPAPALAVYGAGKSYVLHFTEAINHELRHTGVSATASCPGPIDTPFHDRAGTRNSRFVKTGSRPADWVAEQAIRAMFRRKPVIIHGAMNNLMAFLTRLTPRNWLTRIAAAFMQ
jgi:uncharacterized protein